MNDLLEKILEKSKYVSNNSKYVKINYNVLDKVIFDGNFDNIEHWMNINPFGILNMNPKDIIDFLLIYHTIGDYCFWGNPKWEIEINNKKLDGSFAVIYLIIEKYKKDKNFNMNYKDFSIWLRGNVEIPLLKERFEQLEKVNIYLKNNSTDFYESIKDKTTDTELLNYILSNFDFYKDERTYQNMQIPFYKRAQLLVSDILHIRKIKENIKVNYSNLIGCADYKIPQVMRCQNILKFNKELSNMVDNLIELPINSEMETEIRANTLVVIDYIYKKLNNEIPRADINDYIWSLGQDKSKMIKPYHRTKTINY